jgi:hypothetical protein
MNENTQRIDHILNEWPFDPFAVNVRMIEDRSSIILQMRVDMGILQLEDIGRPDGKKPHGASTYYDFLKNKAAQDKNEFRLDEDNCVEIDREFVQFYHRRVCWLQLKEFERAVRDADHTLSLMDFCKEFSDDEEWTISHEQYRPFVLYHRTQAAALSMLDEEDTAEAAELAIEEVNAGLERMHALFVEYDAEEQFEEDELVQRLMEFREGLRKKYEVDSTLDERLAQAIADEDYELAAELRDLKSRRDENQGADSGKIDFFDDSFRLDGNDERA